MGTLFTLASVPAWSVVVGLGRGDSLARGGPARCDARARLRRDVAVVLASMLTSAVDSVVVNLRTRCTRKEACGSVREEWDV